MEEQKKSDKEIKLDCLKIAIATANSIHSAALSYSIDQLIKDAQEIEKYVLSNSN